MKNLLQFFLATMLCSLALASCVKPEEIENLQNQINEIKQENIASIESQIKAINSSITKLETTDKELKGYIETLQTQQDELVKADEALTKSIVDLRTELLNKVSEEKAAILLLLEAYKSEVEGSLAVINNQIKDLQAKDENLQGQITNLKTYVDTELQNTKDWATATFATLEQYNSVCTTIAGIQADITSINETIAALQTKTAQDKVELEGKITALDEKTAAALQSAVSSIEATISTVKDELTIAYTEAIAAAITNLESSLKTWVNNQLTGYYTIAQMDAQLSTLEQTMNAKFAAQKEYLEGVIEQLSTALTTKIDANADAIAAIQGQLTTMSASLDLLKAQVTQNSADIVQLKADLASAKTSITTAYTSAISTAISTLDGKLSAEIESKVSAVNTALNNAVKDINDKITALTARIKACEDAFAGLQESLDKLLARIQSIVVLPTYSDGSVRINFGTTDISFEVTPRSASVALAKADISVFSLDAITTETKVSIFTNIQVTKVADNGEVLVVTVNGSNLSADFFAGTQSMSARLKVQDGNNARTSEFFALSPVDNRPDYIENGVKLGKGIAVLGDWDEDGTQTTLYWAPVNCGYEEKGTVNTDLDHRLGKLYQWGAGDSSLPYKYNGSPVVAREMYYDTATPRPWYDDNTINGTTSDKWNNNQGPCPEGWRLPTSQEFKILCTGKNGSYGWVAIGTYAGQSNTYTGAEFFGANSDKTAGKGVFFPAAGCRGDGDGFTRYRGSEGNYWSSAPFPDYSDIAYCLCFGSSRLSPQTFYYRAGAYSVRCVSEYDSPLEYKYLQLVGQAITNDAFSVGREGAEIVAKYKTNVTPSMEGLPAWATVKSQSTSNDTTTVTITVAPNTTSKVRNAVVRVFNADVENDILYYIAQDCTLPTGANVLFAENFDWMKEYYQEYADANSGAKFGDSVGKRDVGANSPNFYSAKGLDGLRTAFAAKGYGDSNSSKKVIYPNDAYLKFGKSSVGTRLVLPALTVEGTVDATITFNYAFQVQFTTGKVDETELFVFVDGQKVNAEKLPTTQVGGDVNVDPRVVRDLTWQTATLELKGISKDSKIEIGNEIFTATQRFFLDNIVITKIRESSEETRYYIENGVNLGRGIALLGDWDEDGTQTTLYWAPVNCGYEEKGTVNTDSDHRLGKLYQWGAGDSSLPYTYNGSPVVAREMYYDTATPSPWYDQNVFYGTASDKWNNNQGPCPEGWRLPTLLEFKVLCAGKNGSYGFVSAGTYAGQSNTYAGAEFFGANPDKTVGKGVFFPAAGCCVNGDGSAINRGDTGGYWSSAPYPVNSNGAGALSFYSSYLLLQDNFVRALCFSVRCVSE